MKNNSKTYFDCACLHYYWKPMMAYFRALELQKYSNALDMLKKPVLDLGCGDGEVSDMLVQNDLALSVQAGIDIDLGEVRKAQKVGALSLPCVSDANYIPFKENIFATVFSNNVLCSIPSGPRKVFREVYRVLKPGGEFVLTVPLDNFADNLFLTQLLGMLGFKDTAKKYAAYMNRRMTHFYLDSRSGWLTELKHAGFDCFYNEVYFPKAVAWIWDILAQPPFRLFSLLRFVPFPCIHKGAGLMLSWVLRKMSRKLIFSSTRSQELCGYAFFISRK